MADLTRAHVEAAYEALLTGDKQKILEYWHEDLRFEMPGNHQFAGWFNGLDDYLEKMAKLNEACGGRFTATTLSILVNPDDGLSVDITRLDGYRADAPEDATSPYERLQIENIHVLRWENGRIVEGRSALFADGGTLANMWWSPMNSRGERTEL
ncbi:nuclear transport factor 2 family protein [Streptomyces sp. NPDC002680]|uniref:nuclear transport factor 2 family protein n=1 Tax=Streptomyces sp. NPDC002680 TaxID=3364659 RepID=UPI0036A6FA96